jgi:hypothetical protein
MKSFKKTYYKNPVTWSPDDVSVWLGDNGFSQYISVFLSNKVSGESIFSLNINDLEEIGVSTLGHRIKILKKIKELSHTINNAPITSRKTKEKKEKNEEKFKNDVYINFILGKDDIRIGLKMTNSMVESKKKLSKKIGIDNIMFLQNGEEILEEKEWKMILQNENRGKISINKTDINDINRTEKNIIENLCDSTFVIDTRGTVLYVNSRVETVNFFSSQLFFFLISFSTKRN